MAMSYTSPAAFKQALEQRLKQASRDSSDFVRRRQLLVFNRFLARIVVVLGDLVTLKGGLALELRLARARTTRDVDLRLLGSSGDVLLQLQRAARLDLADFMVWEVAPDAEQPAIQNDGMPYDGLRFRAACTLAGKPFGQPFGVDVAFGDPIVGEPDRIVTDDVLAFAGIAPPTLRLYPVVTHVAEKLHAYTMPRHRPNTRVKDLPDLALLASAYPFSREPLRAALEQTFAHRKTHDLPMMLPDPVSAWATAYAEMARENRLIWRTLAAVTAAARGFLDPVLGGDRVTSWDPNAWKWT
jgi:hypothetical protein